MTMSLHRVNAAYFERLFAGPAAKVLLVDAATMPVISMAYTQSQLLQQDVVLTEMVGSPRAAMPNLHCVVYIRPQAESVAQLCAELRRPHYASYRVFFSNAVAKSDLEKLAAADEKEVVAHVAEVFQDYFAVTDSLFCVSPGSVVDECRGLSSVLLALRKCPVVKYDAASLAAKKLASEVLYYINSNANNNLFDAAADPAEHPVLLILDRQWDPVTPLVTPWTYQSMIHELIGITRNVVAVPGADPATLSEQDPFFADSMYLNYGDLTDKFQRHVDEYKHQTKQSNIENLKTQDLAELKKILTRFPEFKKLSNNILKHLNIISELDRQISAQSLWAVGELQQTIVCDLESHQSVRSRLSDVLADPAIATAHKVKLLLLYTSRHPGQDMRPLLGQLTEHASPTRAQLALIKNFNKHFKATAPDAVSSEATNLGQMFNKNRIKISQLFNKGSAPQTDNIYMQYMPRLHQVINGVTHEEEPLDGIATLVPDHVAKDGVSRPKDVIVYFKGGVTYEEARMVHDLARLDPSTRYIVGGDSILNSEQWVEKMCESIPESAS